ncbi:RING finger protein 17 [Sphaerodactylus townsendi]|uniref:RING finger protein 17 n=1 Tax=Sphaerodactylus townsendi TaxID=933632 RepID=UPI00202672D1|nr:RING finger protein 17 [Sphaerodactylus townsendi]
MAQLSTETACAPDVIIEEIIDDDPEKYPEDTRQRKLFQKRVMPFGVKAGSPELVLVSHVMNPCHFYVRRLSQKRLIVHLEKILKQYCNSKNTSPTDILALGAGVFVKSKVCGTWCRATIVELIPKHDRNKGMPCGPTKYKIYDVAMMQLFFIDFGHSEALAVSGYELIAIPIIPEHATLEYVFTEDLCSSIRLPDFLIEAQLRGINKLSLKCSLKDIVPKCSNEGWSKVARTQFLKMVNNKAVQMKVFREENGVLIVDLMKPPANKISSDMPISLRDALVFLDLASFRTEHADQSEHSVPLQYCPPAMPQEKTEAAAVVTYINNPGDFYIQIVSVRPECAFFLKKIDEVYKTESGDNLEILCPIKGQSCIAKFEDGIWYRAQVIGLPGHQQAEVKYVDYGNTAKISVQDMRKIKDEFLAAPAKAIRCKLAHIEPCKGTNEWSSESKDRFEELVQEKIMLSFFIENSPDNVVAVELYQSVTELPSLSCSITAILVNEGLASYVTRNTQTTAVACSEVWDSPPEETFATEMDVLNPGSGDLSQTEDFELECNKELQARISHVVSPNKIFVHFQSAEKRLNMLQERLSAAYSMSEKEETIQWEKDENCVADIHGLNQWQRGHICKIVSQKVVEVFFFDFGVTKTVNTTCLRKLDENLVSFGPLAVICSLADIRPAGGSDHWTATACDTLTQYLSGATVKIIIQEKEVSPFPVKMFLRDNGLYTDVSEYIIKEGLAFRKRRTDLIKTIPQKSWEIHVKRESTNIRDPSPKAEYAPSCSAPEAKLPVTDHEDKESERSVAPCKIISTYKPPAIPSMKQFIAVVSSVADNGTIYVVPKSQEQRLSKMMGDIQNHVKSLGLLEPYSWKQGEACVVRGADTLWYRGKVTEVGSGTVMVQYLDFGYIEKIPQCHLYPAVLYPDMPAFSIPCQLYRAKPVGNIWQPDAVELLQELLTKRSVEICVEEQADEPWGNVSVKLFFSGMSLSSFMAYHKHCINEEEDGDIPKLNAAVYTEEPLEENCEISYEELAWSEVNTPLLPPYALPSLPVCGAQFPVKVTHIVSPNEVYISLHQPKNSIQLSDTEESGISLDSNCKTLTEALTWCNQNIDSCPCLTDFRNEMPCLAQYNDQKWYRAKLLSVMELNPLGILVHFVDYGATEKLPTSRLRQIPPSLMLYPTEAFRVLLAGFKPSISNSETERIPYRPEWRLDALWTMIDCVQGKNLQACSLIHSPDHIVFLYEDGHLVHMKLVEMGLAVINQ